MIKENSNNQGTKNKQISIFNFQKIKNSFKKIAYCHLKFGIYLFFVSCTLFLLSGCTTYNAATGKREFIAISSSEEVSMGQQIHKTIIKENKLSKDDIRVKKIERIGQKLALVSDRQDIPYQFFVIEKDEINAFTIPGGGIYFYTGLMDKLTTDDQIAFVLAHEIGHGAARHAVKKFQAALGYNLIGGLILSQLNVGDSTKTIAALSSNVVMSIVFSSYSRKDEFEADRLGVKYTYLAGYDLKGAKEALEVLQKEAKGPKIPLLLRSHPHLEDRINDVEEHVAAIKLKYGN